jgi:HNH endonuclease
MPLQPAARLAARRRGYDRQWQKLRAQHLQKHPYCVVCGKSGQHVDHIETLRTNPKRRLDPTNLQTLCEMHHAILTNAYDKPRRDPDGYPQISGQVDSLGRHLDPAHPWHDASKTPAYGQAERKQAAIEANRMRPRRK